MFILYAEKNQLHRKSREPVTSGSVNIYSVQFQFSSDWDGLTRTAVFKAGSASASVLLDESGACSIPWEVLTTPKVTLLAGVYGTQRDALVLPTIWASLGAVLEGVTGADAAQEPTPGAYEQVLDELAEVREMIEDIESTGGISDHRRLTHRDAEAQHPISAVEGLVEELKRIPAPAEALTNEELEDLLK